ncbi:hypothetical protein ACJBYY_11785, partial [Streptococcus suis]
KAIVFIITWGIIVILIGLGYILFEYLWKPYIKIIIKKIKRNRLLEYDHSPNQQAQLNKDFIDLFTVARDPPHFPDF